MKITSIQVLRGIAALAVAFLHFAGLQKEESIRDVLAWQAYGWMGVDMFFIISGFIMVWVTVNIRGGTKTASQFIVMRIVRIYPLWFVCMTLVGIFFYIGNDVPVSIYEIPKEEAWSYFFRSFFLVPQDMKPLIGVGWTLIHEMFFYLVFAILLALGLRVKIFTSILIWALVTALGLYMDWNQLSPVLNVIFNQLSFLFMAGMVSALLVLRQGKPALASIALFLGLLSFGALFLTDFNLRENRVLYLILPFSLIVYGLVSREKIIGRATPIILSWLGDISYSIYLTHFLVIIGWRTFLKPFYKGGLLHGYLPSNVAIFMDTICLLLATLITASVFYYTIERPTLKFMRSRLIGYRLNALKV